MSTIMAWEARGLQHQLPPSPYRGRVISKIMFVLVCTARLLVPKNSSLRVDEAKAGYRQFYTKGTIGNTPTWSKMMVYKVKQYVAQ